MGKSLSCRALWAALALVPVLAIAAPASARPPVVVELYTAQGCAACSKANETLADLSDDPGVLALTFPVDYWDYLGWEDTFARPEFAARQRAYLGKLALRDVYTPQVVVDGRAQVSGARPDAVEKLVDEHERAARNPPDMEFVRGGDHVAVGSGPSPRGGGEVWLVRYDPRPQEVDVRRGENRGQTLVQKNVVREIVKLGAWSGRPKLYRLPPETDDELANVILLQGAKGGRILGVLAEKED
jgi:hypothetical protein